MARPMNAPADVGVVGAGPAGAATACRLARLGHDVVLCGTAHGAGVEGISRRTRTLLEESGLAAAAACAQGPLERTGAWGEALTVAGEEFLIERGVFDRALLEGLPARRVRVLAQPVLRIESAERLWRVHTRSECISCRVVVDARGRRAQRASVRGPQLMAIAQRVCLLGGAVGTRLAAGPEGWCWLASATPGTGWMQVVLSPGARAAGNDLTAWLRGCLTQIPGATAWLGEAILEGKPQGRAATARRAPAAPHQGMLRAGDAGVALDCLSGHGIHTALRAAVIVTACAHTYLTTAEWVDAARFAREWSSQLWTTAMQTAAKFYGQQAEVTPTPFWRNAAAAYAALGVTTAPQSDSAAGLEVRPVLAGARIERRRVVVTSQHPRGVWCVDDVELAAFLDYTRCAPRADLATVARALERPLTSVVNASRWLRGQGLITDPLAVSADPSPRSAAHGPAPLTASIDERPRLDERL